MNKAANIALIGEQKHIYELDLAESVLVKGTAGCGKLTLLPSVERELTGSSHKQ